MTRRNSDVQNITSAIAIGSIPNISGSAAEQNMKAKSVQGIGKVVSTAPARGKMKGAGMVLSSLGKLKKKTRSIL